MSFASRFPPVMDVQNTLGALLIGVLIACCLFGAITIQTYVYFKRFPNDQVLLKIIVAIVWLSELGHSICMCQATYFTIVSSYGNIFALARIPRAIAVAVFFSGIIGPVVQVFFAERVRVVSGKRVIPFICVSLSVVRAAMSFVTMAKALEPIPIVQNLHNVKASISSVLAIGAAVDIIISASLSYYLKGSEAKSAPLLNWTLKWTIQTGLTSCILGIAMLVTFLVLPHTFVWIGLFAFLGRAFSCALLASLNGRTFQRVDNVIELRTARHRSRFGDSSVMNQNISTDGVDEDGNPIANLKQVGDQILTSQGYIKETWTGEE